MILGVGFEIWELGKGIMEFMDINFIVGMF